ncbi:MAG: NADH dehydrogenase FAD-containing subunit [Candidatus Melainabacteria bacterium]|nr:NADH dehydrogenase FAD-containing subunit [Candidatus Melainabacteria bacterium]
MHQLDQRHVRIFYAASSLFLLTMTTVFACDNMGALWIAVEMTTLVSSPLVYFDRTKNAVEATWKYLIICSVGIAFALLGTTLIFASSQQALAGSGSMQITDLMRRASTLQYQWLHLGVIFCILGYGTKAGIFPLHNWLPDAHSEAPAPASAMLSGGLLNCALFAIFRITQIVVASDHRGLTIDIVIAMGAVTAIAASLMLLRQHSFKRMWAYSSIENVGIMLVAIGMGSGMLFFLQAANHSIAKVALFLVSGNVVQASGTKRLNALHGVLASSPVWGILLALGALSITGAPPFGMFVSELAILVAATNPGYWPVAVALLTALSISFVAISLHVGRVVCGAAKPGFASTGSQLASSLMPGLLMLCSLLLGLLIGPQVLGYLR